MDRAMVIRRQLEQAQRLHAAGPPTDEYLRWRDGADELLRDLVGADHPLRQAFRQAVAPVDALDCEGLQIEGEHGMAVRIDRGAEVLRHVLGESP
jgi:hypothetical protein